MEDSSPPFKKQKIEYLDVTTSAKVISVKSGGYLLSCVAQITVDDKIIEVKQNINEHYRGLNVVVINP